MTAARRSLALILVAVSALDAWTTYVVLRAHHGRELNPIARAAIDTLGLGAPAAARVLIGLVFAAVLCRVTVLAQGRAQTFVVWGFAGLVVVWWGGIVVSNLRFL